MLTPLFALSGVAEVPDNEVLRCIKLPCAGEAELALKPVGHLPPPCNLCSVTGWSRLLGRPGLACLSRSPPQLAGCGIGAVALTQGLPL